MYRKFLPNIFFTRESKPYSMTPAYNLWLAHSIEDLLQRLYIYDIKHPLCPHMKFYSTTARIKAKHKRNKNTKARRRVTYIYHAYIADKNMYVSAHIFYKKDKPKLAKLTSTSLDKILKINE